MPIPDYQGILRPLLEELNEHDELRSAAAREAVARRLSLTADELAERIPSGQTVFANRAGWQRRI